MCAPYMQTVLETDEELQKLDEMLKKKEEDRVRVGKIFKKLMAAEVHDGPKVDLYAEQIKDIYINISTLQRKIREREKFLYHKWDIDHGKTKQRIPV